MTTPLTATVTTRKVAATARTANGWVFTVTLSNGTNVRRRATRKYAALAFHPETNGKGCCTTGSSDARQLMTATRPEFVVVDLATGAVLKQPGTDLRPVREAAAPRATRTEAQQRAWEKFQKAPARVAREFRKTAEFFNPLRMPERVQSQAHFDQLLNLQAIALRRADLVEALTTEELLEHFNAGRRTGGDLESWAERLVRD